MKFLALGQFLFPSHFDYNPLLLWPSHTYPNSIYSVDGYLLRENILAHVLQKSFTHGVLLLDTLPSLVQRLALGLHAGVRKFVGERQHHTILYFNYYRCNSKSEINTLIRHIFN
jgi:hypothetical protein